MTAKDKQMTVMEQLNSLSAKHAFSMNQLYLTQDGVSTYDGLTEDYWRGVLSGLEIAMDVLGVEYIQYDPLHD